MGTSGYLGPVGGIYQTIELKTGCMSGMKGIGKIQGKLAQTAVEVIQLIEVNQDFCHFSKILGLQVRQKLPNHGHSCQLMGGFPMDEW